jgi:hypothetical protein
VLGRLPVHDGGHGLCERRRRLAVNSEDRFAAKRHKTS